MSAFRIIEGDCIEAMAGMDEASVQTCVTSPPYWGLRDYGHGDQLGLEPTPEEYVANMVKVFAEVRRVLRDDGTVWLNLGDSYVANSHGHGNDDPATSGLGSAASARQKSLRAGGNKDERARQAGYKGKDLCGIPWLVAFALRADGWYLRSEIIWHKPNPMPESVTDRPTKAHEQIFLLSKQRSYFYDADAVREAHAPGSIERIEAGFKDRYADAASGGHRGVYGGADGEQVNPAGRNKRSVWTITTAPFPGAHFATFPPKLIEPCILAGSAEGDSVLDPFAGAGTTGVVALRHNRDFIGCELNGAYAQMARHRIADDGPLLNVEIAA